METPKKKTGKYCRTKGHKAEQELAKLFRELGYSFCKTSREESKVLDACKIDLVNLPIHIQSKAGYNIGVSPHLLLRQMKEELKKRIPPESPEHGKPAVVIHRRDKTQGVRERDEFDTMVHMSMKDFLFFFSKTYNTNPPQENDL